MKRYLITGASRGIGRAIAEKLASPDVTLFLHGRDTVALAEVCKSVKSNCANVVELVHDLAESSGVCNLIAEVGNDPLNLLVNNAGIAIVKPFCEVTEIEWEQTVGVNITAPFMLTQHFAPRMPPGSSIVNILSVAAKTGFPNWSAYCMSKFALEGFSQSVRAELRDHRIRVINIYPAATNTEIWNNVEGDWPRNKMISAEQVASAVVYALERPADVAVENITLGSTDRTFMIKSLENELGINVIASVIASLVFLAAGFAWGKYKERRRKFGRNLEEFDFYPFTVTRENFGQFNLNNFRLGMHYFLKNEDHTAARQLIFIGEQNNVRGQLEPAEQKVYAQLFEKYDGKRVVDDTHEFLENYERIVRLIGKSFPNTGIEILLHNLADPAHSLITLENNVTGRHLRDGATNLLIDFKRRQLQNEDKLNYELNIGSRRFKCTSIPIKRKDFGIVGGICINIDANYITEEVLKDKQRIETWFQNFLRTDMQLDENILSKDEYAKATKGKRHFKDESV